VSAADDKMSAARAAQLSKERLNELMLDASGRGSLSGMSRWLRLGASVEARDEGGLLAPARAARAVGDHPGRGQLACLAGALKALGEASAELGAEGAAQAVWLLAAAGRGMTARRIAQVQDWTALSPKAGGAVFNACLSRGHQRTDLNEAATHLAKALGRGWRSQDGGDGCLHVAARAANFDVCQELLREGWSADEPGEGDLPAWASAARAGFLGMAFLLLDHADPRLHGGQKKWEAQEWANDYRGSDGALMEALARRVSVLEEAELRALPGACAPAPRRGAL
jgi:hypothetical protein